MAEEIKVETPPVAEAKAPAPTLADEYDISSLTSEPEAASSEPAADATQPPVQQVHIGNDPSPIARDPETGRITGRHSPLTIRLAADLGIDPNTIASAQPAELEELVYHLHRAKTEAAPRNAPDTPKDEDPFAALEEKDEEGNPIYDGPLVKIIKKLAADNKALTEKAQTIEKIEQDRQIRSNAERMDKMIESLGYAERLGTGAGLEMAQDSPEFLCRMAVIDAAKRIPGNAPVQEKLAKAAAAILGPKAEVKKANGYTEILEKRTADYAQGGLAQGTNRKIKEPKGYERALQSVRELKRELGATATQREEEFLKGFPE